MSSPIDKYEPFSAERYKDYKPKERPFVEQQVNKCVLFLESLKPKAGKESVLFDHIEYNLPRKFSELNRDLEKEVFNKYKKKFKHAKMEDIKNESVMTVLSRIGPGTDVVSNVADTVRSIAEPKILNKLKLSRTYGLGGD